MKTIVSIVASCLCLSVLSACGTDRYDFAATTTTVKEIREPADPTENLSEIVSAYEAEQKRIYLEALAKHQEEQRRIAARRAQEQREREERERAARARARSTQSVTATPDTSGGWSTAGASWYGPGFYGNTTACGQTYNSSIIGVAHKSLPCGTMVSFRHNGKVVRAPVIDRGPYVAGRMWDLSHGLCQALGRCYTAPIEYRIG